MSLQKPTIDVVKDAAKLYPLLAAFYEAIVASALPQTPGFVPALKAVTMANFADMRKLRGDTLGEIGPRACIVTGKASFMDGSEGVFAWDPTSTATDDEKNTIRVSDTAVGRWRRIPLAATESVKAIASLHP